MSDDGDDNVYTRKNPRIKHWQGNAELAPAYKRSRKQEKETKTRLTGARAIPASGSRFRKTDVEVPNLARIECKATRAKSFSVTRGMLAIVEDAALLNNQIPYIEIEFVNDKEKVEEAYCVLPRASLENLLNRIADAEGITPTDRRSLKGFERHSNRLSKK